MTGEAAPFGGGSGVSDGGDGREYAERVEKLRLLVDQVARDAVAESADVRIMIAELRREGYVFTIAVGTGIEWRPPDVAGAEALCQEVRMCPLCSAGQPRPWRMRANVVRDRVAGGKEREVVEGFQVRWHCGRCGYGEIASLVRE